MKQLESLKQEPQAADHAAAIIKALEFFAKCEQDRYIKLLGN